MIGIIDKNIVRVLTIYSISPGSRFNREKIKENTGMNNTSVNKSLNLLFNLKILTKEGKLYSLNLDNPATGEIIKSVSENYFRLKSLPLSAYFDILEVYYQLAENRIEGDVYLFGSYSKLTFKDNSDIDIAIISEKVDKKLINSVISKVENKIGKKVELHYFSRDFYHNKKDPLVREILQHGVKLI